MDLAPRAHAVMLLTVSFGKADNGVKPLPAREWAGFARWLESEGHTPESLLKKDAGEILDGWSRRPAPAPGKATVTAERVKALLARGMTLGVLLERWERAGLWVLTRSDGAYPDRLRKRLGHDAPPVLFGCGHEALLRNGGIAVVGSRNAGDEALALAERCGRIAAEQGYSVVSGAARGVDEHAMLAALRSEGTVIGAVSDNLLRIATSRKYREHLASGNLVLVSPFQPEARWLTWQAMERNKHIYCLADAAVVACSQRGRGGTWRGAIEALAGKWVPVWVGPDRIPGSGNTELADRGGRWLPDSIDRVQVLFAVGEPSAKAIGTAPAAVPADQAPTLETVPVEAGEATTLYDEFLRRMAVLTRNGGVSRREIAARLDLTKSQVDLWIRRGLEEDAVVRQGRPVRYRRPHPRLWPAVGR